MTNHGVRSIERHVKRSLTVDPLALSVQKDALSKAQTKKLKEQGIFDVEKNAFIVSAILIGQLERNQ